MRNRGWKYTIKGIPKINDQIEEYIEEGTIESVEKIEGCLRVVHTLFKPYFTEDNATFGEQDALEWFETESPLYEFENGLMYEWGEEYNYRLNELYDFADYNRIWVEPNWGAT